MSTSTIERGPVVSDGILPDQEMIDAVDAAFTEADDDPRYSKSFKVRAAVSGFVGAAKESYLGTAYSVAEKIYGKGGSRTRRILGGAAMLAMTTPVAYMAVRGVNALDQLDGNMHVPAQPTALDDTNIELVDHQSAHKGSDVKNVAVNNGEGAYDYLRRTGTTHDEAKSLIWGDSQGAKDFREAMYAQDDADKAKSGGDIVPSMNGGKLSDEAFAKLQAFDTAWDHDHPAAPKDVDPAHTLDGGRKIELQAGAQQIDITLPKGFEHEITELKDGSVKLTINPDGNEKTFSITLDEKHFDKNGLTSEGKNYLQAQLAEHNLKVNLTGEAMPNAKVTLIDESPLTEKNIVWHSGPNAQTLDVSNGRIHVSLDHDGSSRNGGYPKWNQDVLASVTDKNNNVYALPLDKHGNAFVDPNSPLGKIIEEGTYNRLTVGQYGDNGTFHALASMRGTGHADFAGMGEDPAKLTGVRLTADVTESPTIQPDGGDRTNRMNGDHNTTPHDQARVSGEEKDTDEGLPTPVVAAGIGLGTLVVGGLAFVTRQNAVREREHRRQEAIAQQVRELEARFIAGPNAYMQEARQEFERLLVVSAKNLKQVNTSNLAAMVNDIEASVRRFYPFMEPDSPIIAGEVVEALRTVGLDVARHFTYKDSALTLTTDSDLLIEAAARVRSAGAARS